MATYREVQKKFDGMSEEEFQAFRTNFGGEGKTHEWYLRWFQANPEAVNPGAHARFCFLLGLPTESERSQEAQLASAAAEVEAAKAARESADAAKESLRHSRLSAVTAVVAVVISLAAFMLSVLGYLSQTSR